MYNLEEIHFDIQHYTNKKDTAESLLKLCKANESIISNIKTDISNLTNVEKYKSNGALKSMNFAIYGKTLMPVPRGFKGKLLPYLTELDNANNHIVNAYNDVMPKYTEALSGLVSNKYTDALYTKPIVEITDTQTNYTKKLNKWHGSDKEWMRLSSLVSHKNELSLLYSSAESNRAILSDKWLKSVEMASKINTVYLKSIQSNNTVTTDTDRIRVMKEAGKSGYAMAKLLEQISSRAWETGVAVTSVRNIRSTIAADF